MFGIRRGLKRGVSKLVNRGKSETPETPAPTRPAPVAVKPPEPVAVQPPPQEPVVTAVAPTPPAEVAQAASQATTPQPITQPITQPAEKPAERLAEKPAEKPSLTAGLSGIAAMISAGAAEKKNDIDLSVSYTSGPAAEAAAAAMAARDMINHAEDGTPYWGAIDNDSARARAAGLTLVIDQWECIQCGTCVENTEQVFVLPDDAKAVAYRQEGPMELIQDAIDACPVTCIHWTEDPGQYEQLNDTEGNPISA
jgi:ferredoxin